MTEESLEQPSPLKTVESTTTGGTSESAVSDLLCMADAPHDGTPVLLKFKDDMSQFDKNDDFGTSKWTGIYFVGRNRGDVMLWGFAAPVGQGGFPDEWLDGWLPLPSYI